ncbi:MAG: glycoside hydrolase family 3 C-terminal domain-containing protein [bacterium]
MTTPTEERIDDLVSKLTLEEKVSLLAGKDGGETRSVDRLGIPSIKLVDGPHGIGWGMPALAFPTPVNMAASWNTDLVRRVGAALGEETLAAGRQVLLGPCVNIHRTVYGGRNFESFGEDPHLAGRMAVAYITGVQGTGVGTSLKHFACNNQEWERLTIDAMVGERALQEIYLPAFKAAVKEAHPWTVMAAYNMLNGHFCSANRRLLTDILKQDWGFDGVVVSDWGGCHSTVEAANAGLDLEMPGPGEYFNSKLVEAVREGTVSEDVIDEKVRRLLRLVQRTGRLDKHPPAGGAMNTPEHQAVARELAAESIVLLKNDRGTLPLKVADIKSIAVIGPNGAVARIGGGGSSTVAAPYGISPLEGLRTKCGPGVRVDYVEGCPLIGRVVAFAPACFRPPDAKPGQQGLRAEYFDNVELQGEPVVVRIDPDIQFNWGTGSPDPRLPSDHFSARWTGELLPPATDEYDLAVTSDDGSRVYLDGELVINNWSDHGPETKSISKALVAGKAVQVKVEYYERSGDALVRFGFLPRGSLFDEAVALAKSADVAVVCGGLGPEVEAEGRDRDTFALPGLQGKLIQAVAKANPRTIVVLNGGVPVDMEPWIDQVPALLQAWYPGVEGGHALADILFGDVNPSAKIPVTFPKRVRDCSWYGSYPGRFGKTTYSEGIYVGYRHFDKKNIEPRFPFGHGLSYTGFRYSNLRVETGTFPHAQVSVDLENTGDRAGQEVVQVYVRDVESLVDKPAKELRRFQKIALRPGEKKTLAFALSDDAFAYYDTKMRKWEVEPGAYEILVGASSRDIRLRKTIGLKR